jgi:hypothetical protein
MYVTSSSVCGPGAPTASVAPTTAVRTNGVATELGPATSVSPGGIDVKDNATVSGSSRTLVACVSPSASVAVSASSRNPSASPGSGATNDPASTPAAVASVSVVHAPAQRWRTSAHASAAAGSVPCSASVAEPAKAIASPARQCSALVGIVIVATGAVLVET